MLPLTESNHHIAGPKDLGLDPEKKSVMSIDVARTTNMTGEQLHISVPIYADDDRAVVQKRLGFAYSLLQDRMEQENKALEFVKSRSEMVHRADEIINRNEKHLATQLEKLGKEHTKGKITPAEFAEKKTKLMAELKAANAATIKERDHAKEELTVGQEIPKQEAKDL